MPSSAKRILIAPLDWGLGHTTRCIPVIRALQSLGHEVIFAGDHRQQAFIRQSFPQIDTRLLEGYRVRYSRRALIFTLLWQMPRLLNTVGAEHRWLKKIVSEDSIDGIISDNRYGLWHQRIPAVIITHQPGVITGMGKFADRLIRRLHYRFLKRFKEVWIPDLPGEPNLAGRLSHPAVLPPGAQYIGLLSQFESKAKPDKQAGHILILLSGPEPHRTMLSDKLWKQAKALQQKVVFTEGKAEATRSDILPHIHHISLADDGTLQPLLEGATVVICRSGYSTLMDLALLGKNAILIPTPGQTEQEYLAASHSEKGLFYATAQSDFSLKDAVSRMARENNVDISDTLINDPQLLLSVLKQWTEGL